MDVRTWLTSLLPCLFSENLGTGRCEATKILAPPPPANGGIVSLFNYRSHIPALILLLGKNFVFSWFICTYSLSSSSFDRLCPAFNRPSSLGCPYRQHLGCNPGYSTLCVGLLPWPSPSSHPPHSSTGSITGARSPRLADFVDGPQKEAFPLPAAIQATWLWLLPRRDFHPLDCATLRWARYISRPDPIWLLLRFCIPMHLARCRILTFSAAAPR